jgi:cyclopropane fatty-acyl-phospholipid synthase-like methyltransferase
MKRRVQQNTKEATGGGWGSTGRMQLDRLQRYGMQPNHALFDLGCGQLRGGRFLISYLNAGNYTGNDISPEILEAAKLTLQTEGLTGKKPHLFLTDNLEFAEVSGKKFDYIHAQSVLSHMPPEDIDLLFKNIKVLMHEKTQFLATFFLSKDDKIHPANSMKNFFYPFEWLAETGTKKQTKS